MDLIQQKLEEVLTLAIDKEDVNTEIVLKALIGCRESYLDHILSAEVQNLVVQTLLPMIVEERRQMAVLMN